jgi:glucose dehydrogenase
VTTIRKILLAGSALLILGLLAAFALHRKPRQADWSVAGGTPENSHYSTLDQINRSNVGQLKEAWRFDTGESGGMETTPLVIDGILYTFTPTQKVIALDAASGKLLWKFDSGVKGTGPVRGLNYWTSGDEHRILAGVMNFIYALDPATGHPIPTFGNNGRVDLREDLGRDPERQSIALSSPGVVYKDLLIVGGRCPETLPAPPGDIRAYDVRTGALRWSFHTIPHPGELGASTWPDDAWKNSGAANNWAGMSLDPDRGIVFVPTGSAVPDFYGASRKGDNLFANTLIALDAATGKLLWYFQGVHHDIWDRDFPSAPILVAARRDGVLLPAIAQTTKQGYLYVFNRATGVPLFPIEERPYPTTEVPGETTSPTQPFPLAPEPFSRQILSEDTLTSRTPAAHDWAVKRLHEIRNEGLWIPFSVEKDTLMSPSFEGGGEWGGPAIDPASRVLYVNANNHASLAALAHATADTPGRRTYLAQCAVCHGDHRQGAPPTFPGLLGISHKLSTDQITAVIHDGKSRMPANPISGKPLADLLAYLRTDNDSPAPGSRPGASVHPAVTSAPADSPLYQAKCASCHGRNREGSAEKFAPSLLQIGTRYSDAQVRATILNGKGRMPAVAGISSQETDSLLRYLHSDAPPAEDGMLYTMTGYRRFLDPEGYPATAPPWGTLNAIDLDTGKYLWRLPFGEYPELTAKGITNTGSENYGGPIVTAGGLLFIAASNFDHKLHAYDKDTGKVLWETVMPYAGNATPATYMVNERQYVVIAAGGSFLNPTSTKGALYIAFALPD